jgi:16S rRNA (uracil1498-N3)-methyltransferase
MRLTRVYTSGALPVPGTTSLEGAAAAHVTRVLRLRTGQALTLFNGDGWDCGGTIVAQRGGRVEVELATRCAGLPEPPLALTLLQGVARGERMDLVMQKATELGVARIVPVLAGRSVVRLDDRQARRRLEHWQSVTIAACEQCGRSRLPAVEPPRGLAAALAALSGPACRLLLVPGAPLPLQALATGTDAAALLVGPEGGLTDDELELAAQAGFEPRSLGPRVLRTETAAIAAVAVLQAAAGDLR